MELKLVRSMEIRLGAGSIIVGIQQLKHFISRSHFFKLKEPRLLSYQPAPALDPNPALAPVPSPAPAPYTTHLPPSPLSDSSITSKQGGDTMDCLPGACLSL